MARKRRCIRYGRSSGRRVCRKFAKKGRRRSFSGYSKYYRKARRVARRSKRSR